LRELGSRDGPAIKSNRICSVNTTACGEWKRVVRRTQQLVVRTDKRKHKEWELVWPL
jgi:hypothetical protein